MIDDLVSHADNCVYCGLCSQYCPTYADQYHELESPRGRVISSIKVLQSELTPTPCFFEHIKNCLFCGACERACPAKVPVIELLSNVKSKSDNKEALLIRTLFKRPYLLQTLSFGSRFLKKLKFSKLPFFKKYLQLLPDKIQPLKFISNDSNIAFFTGCARGIDPALPDIKTVLDQLKVKVSIPKLECCGALHAHAGDIDYAGQLLSQNLKTLKKFTKIIYVNPGCQDYMQKLKSAEREILDVMKFLTNDKYLSNLKLKPLAGTVLIHIPCSERYQNEVEEKFKTMLSAIPELKSKFLKTVSCCGASKLYSATDNLANYTDEILAEFDAVDFVVSTNLACRLNLQAAAGKRGINVRICHPLSLVKMQL